VAGVVVQPLAVLLPYLIILRFFTQGKKNRKKHIRLFLVKADVFDV
jgi:hypothetical protein